MFPETFQSSIITKKKPDDTLFLIPVDLDLDDDQVPDSPNSNDTERLKVEVQVIKRNSGQLLLKVGFVGLLALVLYIYVIRGAFDSWRSQIDQDLEELRIQHELDDWINGQPEDPVPEIPDWNPGPDPEPDYKNSQEIDDENIKVTIAPDPGFYDEYNYDELKPLEPETTTTTTTQRPRVTRPPPDPSLLAEVRKEVAAELKSYMDEGTEPCEDFFKYACGNWGNLHKVDTSQKDTTTLDEMDKVTTTIIRDILESLPESSSRAEKMARDFYISCINKDQYKPPDSRYTLPPDSNEYLDLDYNLNEDSMKKSDPFDDDAWGRLPPTLRQAIQPYLSNVDGDSPSTTAALSCVTLTKQYFFIPVARLFVQKTFIDKEQDVFDLVQELRSTYKSIISSITWLSEGVRKILKSRFDTLTLNIGYTENIMDTYYDYEYDSLEIRSDSYYSNVDKLNKQSTSSFFLSDSEFTLMANAMYGGGSDDNIVIPAGITQKPYYDPTYPEIINYAKLAVTVGHELSHAFDNYMSMAYELSGPGRPDYLSPSEYSRFNAMKTCIQIQYETFEVIKSTPPPQDPYGYHLVQKSGVNGTLTFDENFADIAGLQLAFEAYMKNHKKNFLQLPGLEGMTQEQLFFIAAAQTECRTFSNDEARRDVLLEQIEDDNHSPNSIRVLGEMINFPEFSKAFQCPKGSRYNPQKQCPVFD